jgi:erythromycin esterase-like protein
MAFFDRLSLSDQLHDVIRPIGSPGDAVAPILDLVGDARIVLIGEASHGTYDFYDYRAEITRRLITEKGFIGVCAEADWPDAWRVNRFVRGFNDDTNAAEALAGFKRFPQWMWRNTVVLDFVNWLRQRNDRCSGDECKCGFYGIDLYSLNGSIRAVLGYLDKVDPAAAARARFRYSCFEDFGEDPQAYGYAASFDLDRSCQDEVVQQLKEMQQRAGEYARRDGRVAEDEPFFAEQNARLVQNAERYYRSMFEGRVSSWNLRDQHMTDTIGALLDYLDDHALTAAGARAADGGGRTARLVVGALNSHLGDASATQMGQVGAPAAGDDGADHVRLARRGDQRRPAARAGTEQPDREVHRPRVEPDEVRRRHQPVGQQVDVEAQVAGELVDLLLAAGQQVHQQRGQPRLLELGGDEAVAAGEAAGPRPVGKDDHAAGVEGDGEVAFQVNVVEGDLDLVSCLVGHGDLRRIDD